MVTDAILSPSQVWDRVGQLDCTPGICDFGELIYEEDAPSENGIVLSDLFVRRRADLWWASIFVIDELKALGAPFQSTVKINYPHNIFGGDFLALRSSFADPVTENFLYLGQETMQKD